MFLLLHSYAHSQEGFVAVCLTHVCSHALFVRLMMCVPCDVRRGVLAGLRACDARVDEAQGEESGRDRHTLRRAYVSAAKPVQERSVTGGCSSVFGVLFLLCVQFIVPTGG